MTSRTKIKICGITTPDDARLASKLGADYLGLIFVESPRKINLTQAREIRSAMHHSLLVGVFRDSPLEEVVETTRAARLDLVQLHGAETPDYCDKVLARTGRPIIKSFMASKLPDIRELSRYRTTAFFLFDLDKNIIENPPEENVVHRMWDIAARKRRKGFRIILAGALDKENVNEAIRRTNAWGVDVCRGVEESPGIKDPKEVERFVAEVRR